jgi:choline monooxygenase
MDPLREILSHYNADAALPDAWTIPASWYTDPRIGELEARAIFSTAWQAVGRAEQVEQPGQYITCEVAGEPLLVVRGKDNVLRGFFNVCRHHAATVACSPSGTAERFRCPYHGWTYSTEGSLTGTPDFAGVCGFERGAMGLVPLEAGIWERWVFVRLDRGGPSLLEWMGDTLANGIRTLHLDRFHHLETRRYVVQCNWKVFVDNYLDGGYHVPSVHPGLDSLLEYGDYTIECAERFCLQSSPIVTGGNSPAARELRSGQAAAYYWIYPNFMINRYEQVMDTNTVHPRGTDRTEVVMDFYFADVSPTALQRNLASIEVSEQIQREDAAICQSVQRGLTSRSFDAGRLSVRREAGEHLFHRLIAADLRGASSCSG